jgi:hypothetical protein
MYGPLGSLSCWSSRQYAKDQPKHIQAVLHGDWTSGSESYIRQSGKNHILAAISILPNWR